MLIAYGGHQVGALGVEQKTHEEGRRGGNVVEVLLEAQSGIVSPIELMIRRFIIHNGCRENKVEDEVSNRYRHSIGMKHLRRFQAGLAVEDGSFWVITMSETLAGGVSLTK
jgi:hypothetical protein